MLTTYPFMKKYFGDLEFDKNYFLGNYPLTYEGGYVKNNIEGGGCFTSFKEDAKYIDSLGVKDYFEIGCACGYLMEEIIKLGINVKGWDISEYIVNQSTALVKPFIEVKGIESIGEIADKSFDLIHISTVLGYVSHDRLDYYLGEIRRISRKYIIVYAGTPEDTPEEIEIREINEPDDWWNRKFSQYFKMRNPKRYLWEI